MPEIESFDETKYEAERLVREAYMDTDEAKSRVQEVANELRQSKAETQRRVATKMGCGQRETYPGGSGR